MRVASFAEGVAMLFLIYARFSGVFGRAYKVVLSFKRCVALKFAGYAGALQAFSRRNFRQKKITAREGAASVIYSASSLSCLRCSRRCIARDSKLARFQNSLFSFSCLALIKS